jgi:hypothetical protein
LAARCGCGGGGRTGNHITGPDDSVARAFLRGVTNHTVCEKKARKIDYAQAEEEEHNAHQGELNEALTACRFAQADPCQEAFPWHVQYTYLTDHNAAR